MTYSPLHNKKFLAMTCGAALVALFFATTAIFGGPTESSADTSLDSEELTFIALLNQHRAQNFLGPLLIDPSLQQSAEWMNNDMGVNHYFDHTDSLGQSPWTRMCNFGYCYNTWKGENLAGGYVTGAAVYNAWLNSPGHDANMLGVNFRVMGLSRLFVPGSTYGYYWTNDFGGYITTGDYLPPSGPTNTPVPTATPSPSPTPSSSPVPTPAGCPLDLDCDGFTNTVEAYVGTDPARACSATRTANDEQPDAMPADTNDDQAVDMGDVMRLAPAFNSGSSASNFDPRFDLSADGKVNFGDVLFFADSFNSRCSP